MAALESAAPFSRVLDIGCNDKWVLSYLDPSVRYVGVDYPETSLKWYEQLPDVFCDAHALPFADESFDSVLLLDVLEHLECGERALGEVFRVLTGGGRAIVQVPFIYPLHDAPRDFLRLTQFGMNSIANRAGFKVEEVVGFGTSVETACLLKNIAVAKIFSEMLKRSKFSLVLSPVFVFYFLLQNFVAWCGSCLLRDTDFMPFSYLFILKKDEAGGGGCDSPQVHLHD